jgi:hypothetical protein
LKANLFWDNYTPTRAPFAAFWKDTTIKWRRNQFFKINFLRLISVLIQDSAIFIRFLLAVITCDVRSEMKEE